MNPWDLYSSIYFIIFKYLFYYIQVSIFMPFKYLFIIFKYLFFMPFKYLFYYIQVSIFMPFKYLFFMPFLSIYFFLFFFLKWLKKYFNIRRLAIISASFAMLQYKRVQTVHWNTNLIFLPSGINRNEFQELESRPTDSILLFYLTLFSHQENIRIVPCHRFYCS